MRASYGFSTVIEESVLLTKLLRDALEVGASEKPILRVYRVGSSRRLFAQAPDPRMIGPMPISTRTSA
ncbi:hypothetical protein [Streptomyces sp. B21-083]|uniref:hypothetical protein n=1 Tax=Streptomyces sp. B21-083 TaxID=3039410 RepID=UPI002FF1213B